MDSVYKRYNKVLEKVGLDGYPIETYDELDNISLLVNLEKSFGISIDYDKADYLFSLESHEERINFFKDFTLRCTSM